MYRWFFIRRKAYRNARREYTRAIPSQELRCRLVTSAASGASILSSKGKFTVNCNWYLNDLGEVENLKDMELYIVDLSTDREYGFFIYLEGNRTMKKGEVFESEIYNGQETLLINMSYSDNIPNQYDPRVKANFVVAQFHTHPPLSKFPGNYWRLLGPSSIDIEHAPKDIPCLLYDYDSSKIGDKLYGMHRIDTPAKIYYYNGTRRPI